MIDNVKIYGLEESIKASKYPMATDISKLNYDMTDTVKRLGQCPMGTGHDNFMNGIIVQFDLTFSLKAWTEMQRYHFIDFVSSQSTMHKITKFDIDKQCNEYVDEKIIEILQQKVNRYNSWKDYKPTEEWFKNNVWGIKSQKEFDKHLKELYLDVLYNIPTGFQLTARMTTNYRQLKTIYKQRKNHRLPEWRELCKEIEKLPYSELITEVEK